MKYWSLVAVSFLFVLGFASFTYGLELEAEYSTKTLVKEYKSPITLDLKIIDAIPGVYNLYTLADISITPQETFTIAENGTFEKEFEILPTNSLDIMGLYAFTYTLNQRLTGEKFEKQVTLNRVSITDILEIYSDSISPEDESIVIYVENMEDVSLTGLNVEFSSIVFENFGETFNLGPHEKRAISIPSDQDALKKTKAGVYVITSLFSTPEGEVSIQGNLYLGEKKSLSTVEDSSGILIQTTTITKTNVGNVVEGTSIAIKKNFLSRLFTTFNVEPNQIDRDGFGIEYVWIKEKINPSESFTVQAKTNYILPFFIIVFLLLFFVGLKRFNETKIEVEKSVVPVKTKSGEFALRITLGLTAKKMVENVTLIDKVPAIVKIYNKFGTVKPDKIDASSRRLHWHIGDLEAGESRSFSYVVYSKVGIVGKFSLPSATAVYEKDGQIHEVESNKVFFMNEQIR